MTFAYTKALALESLNSNRLLEKLDTNRKTYHHVTTDDFVDYARTIAYKVAHNIKNGFPMDDDIDPLTYLEC